MKLKSILLFSLVFLSCGCYNSSPNRSKSSSTGIDEDNVHFIGFWVYERRRNAMKYGDLGITMGIFEAGMAAQTMELVGYHLGIGFCDLGGIEKRSIEKEIKIDGLDTHVIGSFVAGIEI